LLRDRLIQLRAKREKSKAQNRRPRRQRLSAADREKVLQKTGGRCHVCGGKISGAWQADHVIAHSAGGVHAADNYLAAHRTCNNYRWDYLPEEFEVILKLGVWARTQVENGTSLGQELGSKFEKHEVQREARRKKRASR
jgi:5-methylcytosine-specific restriction endonuclease McrA